MPLNGHRGRDVAWAVTTLLLTLSRPAAAHETQTVKQYRLTLGWGEEPAYSGYRNSVDVDLADGAGRPVSDLGGGSLVVAVSFGDEQVGRVQLPRHRYAQGPARPAPPAPARPSTA